MVDQGPAAVSEAEREKLESWLIDFDRAWHDGALAAWVPRLSTSDSGLRLAALVEMVKIDMERQWQQGRQVNLESYLAAYPELGSRESVSAELIVAECLVRRQFSGGVNLDEVARRFRRSKDELRRLVDCADSHCRGTAEAHSEPLPSQRDTSKAALTATGAFAGQPAREVPKQFGRYRIVRKLGEGGMGTVYLAHDSQLDRQVALKVPRFSTEESPQVMERFVREARSAATLHHPNICPVYDAGQTDGIHYLTMAYIEGHPLSAFIQPNKPLPERHVASVVRKLALALQEAHERGIVHRDLKPSNVIIDRRREPVVMDFGLARRADAPQSHLTQSGTLLGTPAYMSPEQVLGQPDQVGPQADVYSLGVMLYELLTGQLPFYGPPAAVIGQILTVEPPPPQEHRPDLDERLTAICRKAMAKQREDRYASMKELAAALGDYLQATKPAGPPLLPAGAPEAQTSLARHFADIAKTATWSAPRRPAWQVLAARLPRLALRTRRSRALVATVAAAVFGLLLVWGVMVTLRTSSGTLIVEVDDPEASVQVLGEKGEVLVQGKGEEGMLLLRVDPGKRRLRIEKDGMVLFARDFTLAPGGTETIRARLEPSTAEKSGASPQDRISGAAGSRSSDTFEHSLMTFDLLETFYCSSGQYSRWDNWLNADVTPGEGVKLWGGHTPTALWAPVAVGSGYQVSLEVRREREVLRHPAYVLLGGPGYGNSIESSYCVVVDDDTALLLREGVEQCRSGLKSPIPAGQWFRVEADVDAGHVRVRVDGSLALDFTDPQPLAGPLHAWIGFAGGRNEAETWYRNLRISGPKLARGMAKELLPPITVAPLPNGPVIYELSLNQLGKDWWLSCPDAVNVRNGSLDLRGINAHSQLFLDRPLHGNVAMEVEMEYPTHETLNFNLALWAADALPRELNSRAGGWLVWLPGNHSTSTLQWHGGPDQFDWLWRSKSEILAKTPYYVPARGRRYTVRLEAVGNRARVFLDGRLLLDGQRPLDAPGKDLPFYAAIGQVYGPVLLHAVRVYQLPQTFLPSNLSEVTDPEGNLIGDTSRRFMDVVRAAVEMRGDRYELTVQTAESFPAPEEMAGGKRVDFVFKIDADRSKQTAQSRGLGNDYNIHLIFSERGWSSSLFRVSQLSRQEKQPDRRDFRVTVQDNTATLSFPSRYLPFSGFEWTVQAMTGNAHGWLPKTHNPYTQRRTFQADPAAVLDAAPDRRAAEWVPGSGGIRADRSPRRGSR